MTRTLLGIVGALVPALAQASGPSLGTTVPETQIAGGQEVVECAWVDTVAVTGGGGLCSGSLVHPRVVVYAAHCGDGNKQIRFGESTGAGGGYTRQTDRCVANPDYLGTNDQAHDWAFCVLEEPVTEIPVTPPLYGCELEMITQGQPVVIAGFGISTDDGSGTKRWATTEIISTFGNTANIGGDGVSTCSGDSGSSAFIQVADGSWRSFTMTSTGIGCGKTGVHSLMHPAIPWIEETAQIDITPCHDIDGTWNPTGACGGFYAGDETPYGTWDNWCEGTPSTGAAQTCGEPYDAQADGEAPVVSVTAPADASEVPSGMLVSIAIDAVDVGWGVREVWVEIQGMEQPNRDQYPPYGFDGVQFPDGIYTVKAFAVDWADNVGESAEIIFGVGMPVGPTDDTGADSDSGGGAVEGTGAGDSTGAQADDEGGAEIGGESSGLIGQDDPGSAGCGCTQGGTGGVLWLVGGLLGLRRRRVVAARARAWARRSLTP